MQQEDVVKRALAAPAVGGPPAWGRGAPQARWLASQATEQEELRLLRSVGGRGFQLGRT